MVERTRNGKVGVGFLLIAYVFLASCSSEQGTSVDAEVVTADMFIAEVADVPCKPSCGLRECGLDNCGGSCGECGGGLACSDSGQCLVAECETDDDCEGGYICHPGTGNCGECIVHDDCGEAGFVCEEGFCSALQLCVTSLECPDDEVCDMTLGHCVGCAGTEDCPEGYVCGGDGACYETQTCASDKECKDFDMICNKSKGLCVDCLDEGDCPTFEHCAESTCLTDSCWEDDSYCQENQIFACTDGGVAYEVVETCESNEYCEDAQCHAMQCMPDVRWCEGMVRRVCDPIGKDLADETDCEVNGLYCLDGECVDIECIPNSVFCSEDFTVATCAADGLSAADETCPDAHYCLDGECLPWVCVPDLKVCLGEIAAQCNAKGSVEVEIDCEAAGQGCKSGDCADFACEPASSFCIDAITPAQCSADGFTFDTATCPAQHLCSDGLCAPWQCEPGVSVCDGSTLITCADDGSGPSDTVDCANTLGFCFEGECVDCIPSCAGLICGDDGCGGSCGTCNGGQQICVNGACQCAPACDGKVCGTDGCGGSCGICLGSQDSCAQGKCVCLPDCNDSGCGSDGCGGSCGTCDAGQYCIEGQCPPAGKTCEDGNDEPWDGCLLNDVAEYLLTAAGSDETGIRLAPYPGGGHVATWVGDIALTPQVHLARFGVDGEMLGQPKAADLTGNGQSMPAIIPLINGQIVVAWDGYGIDLSSRGVHARVFNSQLSPVCPPFVVNTSTAGDQDSAAVGALADGGLVVAWESGSDQDGSSTGIFARIYQEDCSPLTAEFQVNTFTFAAQYGPTISGSGEGFVAVWNSVLQDGASGGLFGQRFNGQYEADGLEFPVNSVTDNNQRDPAVASFDGGFRLAWESNNQDGSNWGIFTRNFNASGTPDGAETQVNLIASGEQSQSAISCTMSGACVVAWRHKIPEGFETRYRRISADGKFAGKVVVANVGPCSTIERPAVALSATGEVVIGWTGSGYGVSSRVVARRFDEDDTPLYH
jgi:hypothetical protein